MAYVKCTDCGLVRRLNQRIQETGVWNDKDCPNCGGELVRINDESVHHQ